MAKQLKIFIKSRFPFLVPLLRPISRQAVRQARALSVRGKSPKQVFTEIYRGNTWGDKYSLSGPGSNLTQTEVVRRVLPLLIRELNCKSILDLPCGDFAWMKLVEMDVEYIGGDIVDELIRNNQTQYSSNRRKFIYLDILQDELPKVDLVFCRDCLIHFSNRDVLRAIQNIKSSDSTYLLTTTYVGVGTNKDIHTGLFRPINLQLPPFGLPMPMRLIDEGSPLGINRDRRLGLWKTHDIPDF
jgi:hypothetical protein